MIRLYQLYVSHLPNKEIEGEYSSFLGIFYKLQNRDLDLQIFLFLKKEDVLK